MALMVVVGMMVLSGAGAMSMHQRCNTDADCTTPDTYCYPSRKCVNCTDCGLYNRYAGTACAKDKNQCGECLPGMDSENNLDGTFSCHPSGTLTPSTQAPGSEAPNDNSNVLNIVVFVFAILMLVSGAAWLLFGRSTDSCVTVRNSFSIWSNSLMNREECSKCPPPYSETEGPTAPPEPLAPPNPLLYQQVCRPVENEPSQRANAYSNPQYVRGGNLGTNPEPAETEDEAEENDALINSPISQPGDDETQPSNWTPTSGNETSIVGPTSFTGALQQLTISEPDHSVQGPSSRSNSYPNIQFNTQSQQDNSGNNSEGNLQQINIIAHVGPVYINK